MALSVIPNTDPAYTALLLFAKDPADFPHCKLIELRPNVRIPIGRVTSSKNQALPGNCYFDARVLSRKHGEIWANSEGRVFICDIGSSNGTFINDQRLSPDNTRSDDRPLSNDDKLEFGVNIYDNNEIEIVHRKVSVCAKILPANSDQNSRKRFLASVDEYFSASIKLPSPGMIRSNSSSASSKQKNFTEQITAQLAKNRTFATELYKMQRKIGQVHEHPNGIMKFRLELDSLEKKQVSARQQIDHLLEMAAQTRTSVEDQSIYEQLEHLSIANKAHIAEVSDLEKKLQQSIGSKTATTRRIREEPSSSNFTIFLSFIIALLAALYYVCTNPTVEQKIIGFSVANLNFDPTDIFEYVKNVANDCVLNANELVDQLKNYLFPRIIQ